MKSNSVKIAMTLWANNSTVQQNECRLEVLVGLTLLNINHMINMQVYSFNTVG